MTEELTGLTQDPFSIIRRRKRDILYPATDWAIYYPENSRIPHAEASSAKIEKHPLAEYFTKETRQLVTQNLKVSAITNASANFSNGGNLKLELKAGEPIDDRRRWLAWSLFQPAWVAPLATGWDYTTLDAPYSPLGLMLERDRANSPSYLIELQRAYGIFTNDRPNLEAGNRKVGTQTAFDLVRANAHLMLRAGMPHWAHFWRELDALEVIRANGWDWNGGRLSVSMKYTWRHFLPTRLKSDPLGHEVAQAIVGKAYDQMSIAEAEVARKIEAAAWDFRARWLRGEWYGSSGYQPALQAAMRA